MKYERKFVNISAFRRAALLSVSRRDTARSVALLRGRKDGGEHTFNQYLSHIIKSEGAETTSTPVWYDTQAETMTTIPTMEKGSTAFLITGDASRNKVQTMPGGGFSTVRIDLPVVWDSLMTAKGYPALSDMLLTPTPGNSSNTDIRSFGYNSSRRTALRTINYRPSGQRIARPRRGMYIQQNYYVNGQSDAKKWIYR